MNFLNICGRYGYIINGYVDRICSTFDAIATSGHGVVKSNIYSNGDTESVVANCFNEFISLLERDYKDASRREIESIALEVFEKRVFPNVKKRNEKKVSSAAYGEMLSEGFGAVAFFGIAAFIFYLLSKLFGG